MNLREQLLLEHSRANCDRIVDWVGSRQDRFDELFSIFIGEEYRLVQHAAWPVSYVVIAHPLLIKKHFKKLVLKLQAGEGPTAVRRNILRLLQEIEIPKAYHGNIMNACFQFIADPREAVAVKAFALTVLENLSRQYPDIVSELSLLVKEVLPHNSAAFKSRARKFLQRAGGNKNEME